MARKTKRRSKIASSNKMRRTRRVKTGVVVPTPTFHDASPSNGIVSIDGFNGSEGSVYLEFTDSSYRTSDNSVVLYLYGSAGNRYFHQKRQFGSRARHLVQSGGQPNEIFDSYQNLFANGTHRILINYSSDTFEVWFDGMLLCSQIGNYNGANFTGVEIGSLNGSNTNSSIKEDFKYWDSMLNHEESAKQTGDVSIVSGVTFDATKKLFPFLGQSNAEGVASGSTLYTNDIFNFDLTGSLVSYSDPYADNTGSILGTALGKSTSGVSAAGFFADAIGNNTVVAPACLNSTSFFGTTPTWNTNSVLYRSNGSKIVGVTATATAAMQFIQIAKLYAEIEGFIWLQGEGDVASGTSRLDYEDALKRLIDMVRNATQSDATWYNSGFPNNTGNWAGGQTKWDDIYQAQQNVATEKSGVKFISGNNITGAAGDRVHYDLAGYEFVGENIAGNL